MLTQEMLIAEIVALCPNFHGTITIDTALREELMFSSLKMMMLVVQLEELAGMEIPIEKLHEVQTVGDLFNLICETVNET